MRKGYHPRRSWPRIFLWAHVLGVIGFYLALWLRTIPDKEDRVTPLPPPPASRTRPQLPEVSIIVPARNEESNIRRCITSLLEQDYENFEVIVVDDGSTDNTGCILDELAETHPQGKRLWVLRLNDLPPGWAGKPHAIHKGTQEAHGEWLLFTDADTWHAPNALRSAMTQALAAQVDLFTMDSTQELPSFWDRVLMPMAFLGVSMLYPPRKVNDPESAVAVANGQYILIRRKVYDLVGGYARPDLRATLLDDRDLAHVVKATGFRLRFVDGRGLLRVHMYHGLDDIWRGWRKNAFLGNRGGVPFLLLQLLGLPLIAVIPFLLPLLAGLPRERRGVAAPAIGRSEAALATALEMVPLLAYRTWLNLRLGMGARRGFLYALTHPLAALMFDGILAQSMWRVLTGKGVDWRGRQYRRARDI
jgi:chlorobactene glucosyltransferase